MNSAKSSSIPRTGMILAAGLGSRMQPITETLPKPLVKVHGKTLLDHGLDMFEKIGVNHVVINVHHHADQIEEHLKARTGMSLEISDERKHLLDSGGGVKKALPKLGEEPFFLLNADSFWIEGYKPNLIRMAKQWDPAEMDILVLLAGLTNAVGFTSRGDFHMDAEGRLERRSEHEVAPFAYAGAAIINPDIFETAPDGPFSLNMLFDEALEKERMFGLRLEGLWLHVGTPDAIREAEEAIARSAA